MSDDKESVTLKKTTLMMAVIGVLLVTLVASVFTQGFGIIKNSEVQTEQQTANQNTGTQNTGNTGTTTTPAGIQKVEIQITEGTNPVKGNANAKISLIEMSNFECPFCWRFASQTLPTIKAQLIDTGKVNMYYRDFPVTHGTQGPLASQAARCAAEQGKYWEMHDAIFDNYQIWADQGNARVEFKKYAGTLELDQAAFDTCLDADKYSEQIQEDVAFAQGFGVGTPAFIMKFSKEGFKKDTLQAALAPLVQQYTFAGRDPLVSNLFEDSDGNFFVIIQGALPPEVFTKLANAAY